MSEGPLPQHRARQLDLLFKLMAATKPLTSADLYRLVGDYRRELVKNGGNATAALAKKFERDREALHEMGFDVEPVTVSDSADGKPQERFQLSRAHTAGKLVSLDARERLLVALASRIWLDPKVAEQAQHGYLKLLPLSDQADTSLPTVPSLAIATPDAFQPLLVAITTETRVTFDYHKPTAERPEKRKVDPLQLLYLRGRFLLHAWDIDRNAHRNFLLNRITSEVDAVRPAGDDDRFNPEHTVDPHLAERLEELSAQNTVVVRVRAGSVEEAMLLKRGTERGRDGESVILEVHDWDLDLLCDGLASFVTEVTVLEPPRAKAMVRDRLARAYAAHTEVKGA